MAHGTIDDKAVGRSDDDANRRDGGILDRWLYIGLCTVVALLPIPFGGARPFALDIFSLSIGFLLLASTLTPQPEVSALQKLKGPTLLFAAVVAYIALQSSPYLPESWHNPVWHKVPNLGAENVTGYIAASRPAVLNGLMRWLAYAGVFYLAFKFGRDAKRARTAIKVVATCGMIYAAYGLIVYWSGNKTVLWFDKWTYLADLTGPFVNRNSFATYLGLCQLAALSELVARLEHVQLSDGRRHRLVMRLQFIGENSWLLIGIFVIVTAQVLTHSRGGFIFTVIAVLVLAVTIWRTRRSKKPAYVGILLVPFALGVGAFLVSGDRLVDRLIEGGNESFGRVEIYQTTLRAIAENPILGSGLGSFSSVFPIYRSDDIPTGVIERAHNDYLETVLDLGIPAAICFFAAMVWLIWLCVRGVMERRRNVVFSCAGLAASTLVALHATVDFSLQVPAVAVVYLFLLGVSVAQSQPTRIKGPFLRPGHDEPEVGQIP